MSNSDLIADKTYMYGKRYEPDNIDILEEIKYDFSATTLYNLEPLLILPIWRIISDYAEPYKKLIVEIWKYKNNKLKYCNWFGEYTFGTTNKIWLTNKGGQTFQDLYDETTKRLKTNYTQLIRSQLNSPNADYDSKKRAFGFGVLHFGGIKTGCIDQSLTDTYIREYGITEQNLLHKNTSIFISNGVWADRDPLIGYVNIALVNEVDDVCREIEWLVSLCERAYDICFE